MNFTDDEVIWIAALLGHAKKHFKCKLYSRYSETSEARSVTGKIYNGANQIVAKRARSVIKPGDWI